MSQDNMDVTTLTPPYGGFWRRFWALLLDSFIASIGNSIEDDRSDEVHQYLKYENRNVKIFVRMNQNDYDDYEFVAEADDGEILLDYPLPEKTSLSVNRSTMIATDSYGKKYPLEFV